MLQNLAMLRRILQSASKSLREGLLGLNSSNPEYLGPAKKVPRVTRGQTLILIFLIYNGEVRLNIRRAMIFRAGIDAIKI